MELYNLREVVGKLERLPDGARQVIEQAFDLGLQKVVTEAKTNHPEWPSKIFNPDGTWRYHDITTNLTNSINMEIFPWKGDILEGDVGVKSKWAKVGVMAYGEKMERDHPYIGPAVEAKKEEWIRHIQEALKIFFR